MMAKFRIPASFAALLLGTLAAAGCTSEGNPDSETGTGTDTAVTDSPTGSTTDPTSTTNDTVDPPEDTTTGTSDTSSTETTPGTSMTTTPDETTTEEPVTTSVGTSETSTTTTDPMGSTTDEGTTSGVGLSFATDVYPVAIQGFCSCHDGGGKLNLTTAELAFSSFVGVDSGQAKLKIVAPGDVEGSYLLHKLEGTQGDVGGGGDQMPKGAAPLSGDQIDLVSQWIADGALP